MKDKLIKLLRRAEKDKPYPDELAEEIMELIDAQRCVWTRNDDGDWDTECKGWFAFDHCLDDLYCPACGLKIEVKDGQE